MSFSWKCPFCKQHATITEYNFEENRFHFDMNNKYGGQCVTLVAVVCPNKECGEYCLAAGVQDYRQEKYDKVYGPEKDTWKLVPRSSAEVYPDYIPALIRADYEEACAICALSPKASATLSRRCLQGMIRDFWGIQKGRLVDEIDALQGKVDAETWQAIDAVRTLGNIGAHMEKDINIIIDVDPDEAVQLTKLIEILMEEWYIARHERQKHLESIAQLAQKKEAAKSSQKPASGDTKA
jgi:hypothetical protein